MADKYEPKKQTLITTRFGKYVWYPILNLIDFLPTGARRARSEYIIHLTDKENTELRAMIKATNDMLNRLKEIKKENDSEASKTV